VQRLVRAAGTGEDEDRIRLRHRLDELHGMARPLREERLHARAALELGPDGLDPLVRHLARERVDDEYGPPHPGGVSRIDHGAVESPDPDATAAFYERVFGARIVKAEGHPVMAYLGPTGIAVHK